MRFIIMCLIFVITGMTSLAHAVETECSMKMNFDTSEAATGWRAVNDGVMGGKSSGGPRFSDAAMVFEGVINTNGGGFSSIRTDVKPGVLSNAKGLKLRVRSDGRIYKITMRTNARYRFRRISFQANIPPTTIGEWMDVVVPFDALKASLFGRPIQGAKFNRHEVQELGIILADGQDGPFRLDVKTIEVCSKL